MQVV
ncbi:unnamed protein product, partial [Allacma fusca]|jgi:hypothetical protein